MIKAIIVDDEPIVEKVLATLLKRFCPEVKVPRHLLQRS